MRANTIPQATTWKRDDRWCRSSDKRGLKINPETARCVREVDAQSVLQFTLQHKVGFALPRHTSRVIHRLK